MPKSFYSTHDIENIARRILTAYDSALYYGNPAAVPIEDIVEAHGLSLEYQYLRKNGRILGKAIFDDGLEAVYDMDKQEYILFPVKAGTILIDASLCDETANTGRLRFTCAHELAHWVLHRNLYIGTGESAALEASSRETNMEVQANMLGSALLMPMPQVKRCFYSLRAKHSTPALIAEMAAVFEVSRQAMRIRLEDHHLIERFLSNYVPQMENIKA